MIELENMIYKQFNVGGAPNGKKSPFGGFVPLIFLVLFFVALFFLAKGLFYILNILAPLLLIAALVIDYTVVTDYLKMLGKLLKDNPLFGILAVILTIVGYPFVSGFLLFKAYMKKKLGKVFEQAKEDRKFDEYEEVTEDADFLELPELETPKQSRDSDVDYEDLFD